MLNVPFGHGNSQRPTEPCRFKFLEVAFAQNLHLPALGVFPPLRGENYHLDVDQAGKRFQRQRIVLVKQQPFDAVAASGLGTKIAPQRSGGKFDIALGDAVPVVKFVLHVKPPEVNLRNGVESFFHCFDASGGISGGYINDEPISGGAAAGGFARAHAAVADIEEDLEVEGSWVNSGGRIITITDVRSYFREEHETDSRNNTSLTLSLSLAKQ